MDRIGNTTEFNTQKLLNGSLQSAGAVTGTNLTAGAKVLNQTAAKLVGDTNLLTLMGSGINATALSTQDTIKIDKARNKN